MSITTEQLKTLITREVNKLGVAEFIPILDLLWEMYSGASDLFPYSQYLYVKRHALILRLGELSEMYDTEEKDVVEKERQKFLNYIELLKITENSIALMESQYGVDTDVLATTITKSMPLEYPNEWIDPSSIFFSGTPIWTNYANASV